MKTRNLEITRKRLNGTKLNDLVKEYKIGQDRLSKIISDTKNKYQDELQVIK